DKTSVALERAEWGVRLRVPVHLPDLHRGVVRGVVAGGRRDELAVRADVHGSVGVGIMSDLKVQLLAGHVPDLDGGSGSAGRNQAPAVGAEGQTRYPGRGPLEGMDLVSGGRVVEGDPAGQADGQEQAVPAEADGGYPLGAGNGSPLGQGISLRGRQVPELDGVVPAGGSEGSVVGG